MTAHAGMPDLPNWVWDVLGDLLQYEYEHGRDWPCLDAAFERIPKDVRMAAAVLKTYQRRAGQDGVGDDLAPEIVKLTAADLQMLADVTTKRVRREVFAEFDDERPDGGAP